ncbi:MULTISPECIES: sodium/glutamate symporter [Oceanobacillus]|uniref:Sodium/glutamate symporter n=1 Tax=Oceanobacillus aidingensis TaxID=645964 RepID=A0ABV9K0C9_9BACI|nr:sodium/glutamate symporter [Oceanobacillus oncorhynchi]MDM8101236.1 sodium/glutamate symporter [Oceanobacillus oncorhynchi]UUI39502.1 hypothetical protein NP440_19600 [Oceanobacillus oncorhynchi]
MIPTEAITSENLNSLLFYFTVMGLLLVLAIFVRLKIKIFKKYFIPASLIAGILGLFLGPYGAKLFSEEMVSTWGALAGILISVVFAPMLIGMKKEKQDGTGKLVARHLIYSYTGSLLQISIPLIVASLILIPLFDLNEMFASIIEVGWAGGHGTAAGMIEVYNDLGWTDGASLGVTAATFGIIIGIISGVIMINHGVRKGYTSIIKKSEELSGSNDSDVIPIKAQKSNSVNTLNPDLVESFAFHAGLISIAILIGWFIQQTIALYIPGIPLFPLAMIGGLIVNLVISKTKYVDMIDVNTLNRIQGIALDFLVLGAVASIQIPIVLEFAVPLAIITIITVAVMIWYFYFLGKRFFPKDWFENSIVHYGAYSGVTAIGLMLLRTVDPEMKTDAAKGFALRAPFYSPILGGGLITSIIPVLMLNSSSLIIGVSALGILVLLLVVSKLFGLFEKPQSPQSNEEKVSSQSKRDIV